MIVVLVLMIRCHEAENANSGPAAAHRSTNVNAAMKPYGLPVALVTPLARRPKRSLCGRDDAGGLIISSPHRGVGCGNRRWHGRIVCGCDGGRCHQRE